MLTSLRRLLAGLASPDGVDAVHGNETTLQLAAAVLLIEVMRADRHHTAAEERAIRNALATQFRLDAAAVEALLARAAAVAEQATDDHRFTSCVNRDCDAAEKARIVEHMWRIALADGHLDAHEDHYLRKIARLLHIPHATYIAAKQRARDDAGA